LKGKRSGGGGCEPTKNDRKPGKNIRGNKKTMQDPTEGKIYRPTKTRRGQKEAVVRPQKKVKHLWSQLKKRVPFREYNGNGPKRGKGDDEKRTKRSVQVAKST